MPNFSIKNNNSAKTATAVVLLLVLVINIFFSGFPGGIKMAQAAVAYRSSGTFTAGTGSITPPYPASMVAGDVCLLVVTSENQAISLTTANGFVQVPTWSPQYAGTAASDPASRLAVYWKRTVGGDSAPVVADSGNNTEGVIHCFSGVISSGNPWNTGAGGNDGAVNDTTGVIPGSTTTVDNALVVLIISTSYNNTSSTEFSAWTNAGLTSITERQDNSNTSGLGGGSGMATGIRATAGAYGDTTVTLAHTSFKGAISLALMPELPPTFTQSAYRLFNNLDSTDVGTPLTGLQDTGATLNSSGEIFRLRMLLQIATGPLNISGESFKLQYVGKGTGTCAAPTGGTPAVYTDVTTSTDIAYRDNVTPLDGTALTANSNDPTYGTDSIVNQTYEELNNFTNSVAAVPLGQDGKWDFALFDNNAPANTIYCLRAVKSDGTVLSNYIVYPEITTAPPIFNQKSYRFENTIGNFVSPKSDSFQDQTNLADTARTEVKIGERFFLRINVENSGSTDSKQFGIQFGAGATCSTVTYSDVGSSTAISYADGLSGEWGDLGILGQTVSYAKTNASTNFNWTPGVFVKNSNLTSATSIGNNKFSEFVFLLDTLNATAGTQYCFRLYNTTNNTTLNTYTVYPAVTIVASVNDTQKFSKNISVTAPTNTDSSNILPYRLDDEGYHNLTANDTSIFNSATKLTTSAYNKMYIRSQVYGNKIYYVWHEYDASTIYQIWTANSNLDGTGFVATKQTSDSLHEHAYPQLQVYGNKIYYVGHFWDGTYDQIWMATTNLDGTGWIETQLTYTSFNDGYPQLQIYGNKIYYVWQERDASSNWHIWTASTNLDGTGLVSTQRTTGTYNEGYPQLQVYGNKIYYVWQKIDAEVGSLGTPWDIWTANSDLDGTNFVATMQFTATKLVTTSIYHRGFPQLQVYGNKIYYTWHEHDSADYIIWTANSNLDGTGFVTTARETSTVSKFYSVLRIYGSKIYYAWYQLDPTYKQIFTANSNLDGTEWKVTQLTNTAYDKYIPQLYGYGSKMYYTWYENDGLNYQAWMARAIFGDRVENSTPPSGYNQFLFKQKNSNLAYDQISVSWDGRASITVPTPTISLQIYNNTTALWEDLATSNTYSADTDFTLTGSKTAGLSSYYDANYFVTLRVIQSVSEKYLETDYLSVTFSPPTTPNPTISNVQLNGQANINLTESTTTPISVTAYVSDPQGCTTLSNVIAKIYRSGVVGGKDCTPNDNNCYSVASCTQNTCVGTDATYTCTINMQFFADPTDIGTPWSSEYWKAWVQAIDVDLNTGSAYNTDGAPELNSLLALSVTPTIDYGNFNPGSFSTTLDKQTTVTSTGNVSLDTNIYGTAMTSGVNSIAIGQQKYSLSTGTVFASGTQLVASPGVNVDTNICKNISTTKQTKDIWWGIAIPNPQPTGTYSGSNTFSAVKNAWAIPGDWCE